MNIAATLINRARSAPDRAALTWRDGTLSYGAFVDLAARIAADPVASRKLREMLDALDAAQATQKDAEVK